MSDDDPAEELRYVFIDRPRCPRCYSDALRTKHSENQGDGSTKRDTECRDCGWRFYVVIE
jgi:transcriptional regulator NrdR family protein